jgi:hypothetical protein
MAIHFSIERKGAHVPGAGGRRHAVLRRIADYIFGMKLPQFRTSKPVSDFPCLTDGVQP